MKPRYKKTESKDELVITIPSNKDGIFLLIWFSFWIFGGIMVILEFFKSIFIEHKTFFSFENIFILVWLCFWIAGLTIAIYALAWTFSGNEEIKISSSKLKIGRKTFIWSSSKEFYLAQVKSFRAFTPNFLSFWFRRGTYLYGDGGAKESFAFDYGAKTIKFGLDLDEAEAKMIVQDIQNKFPELCES
ncbi:MAG: hypothetical protein SFU25_11020 [Candidatus Caenarcaniphilales bacterium]|nr:hypothetical protein [Candidatus Caenarcaniphilales bacterium]